MFLYSSKLLKSAKKLKALFFDLIFPIECLNCGQEGAWLCDRCFRQLTFKSGQYCLHCKQENKFGQFCPGCQPLYALDGVLIAGNYEDKIIAQLIKGLKYRFAKSIAKELGKFLALFLRNIVNKSRISRIDLTNGVDLRKFEQASQLPGIFLNFNKNLIIPVPLHKKRKRWRGFNQAEVITDVLVNYFNLDISIDRLVRIKHKKPQAKLGEADRKTNIVGCFAWLALPNKENKKRPSLDLAGQNIILIDDVVTTGSTLNECAKVLKQAGANEVWGLVVAKG